MGELCGLGVEVHQIGDFGGVQRFGQPQIMQDLGKGRGHEYHVIARSTGRDQLAHDLFIGGLQDQFGGDAGLGGKAVNRVGGHVAIPVGNGQRLGRGGTTCDKPECNQARGGVQRTRISHAGTPCHGWSARLLQRGMDFRASCELVASAVCFRKKIRQSVFSVFAHPA